MEGVRGRHGEGLTVGHLGEMGVAREEHDATFGYFGTTIRVHPDLSDIAVFDLFTDVATAVDGADAENAEDVAKLVEALRAVAATLVHPDDAEEFWRLARANRQSLDDVAGLAMRLLGALADRPTERPSVSSDGPSSTAATSGGGSSLPALRLLENRPDLAVAVLRAEESRASA